MQIMLVKVIFKSYVPFTNCMSEINHTQIDNAKDIDVLISTYNSIEYFDNYSKTFWSLLKSCKLCYS